MTPVALPGDPLRPPSGDTPAQIADAVFDALLCAIDPDVAEFEPLLTYRGGCAFPEVMVSLNGVTWTLELRPAARVAYELRARIEAGRPRSLPNLTLVVRDLSRAITAASGLYLASRARGAH